MEGELPYVNTVSLPAALLTERGPAALFASDGW
jgi:hypothetical protein